MVAWGRALLFGFLIWLIPFAVAFALFEVRNARRPLFESIMPVTVALVVVVFAVRYFRRVTANHVGEGMRLGLLWMAISVLIDLPLMISPPISMTPLDYAADIGLTYTIMPIITTGMGVALQRSSRPSTSDL